MDEKSGEVPSLDIRQATVNARRLVVDEIAAKDNFTPEEALDLAGRFIAYGGDYEVWEEDASKMYPPSALVLTPEDWRDVRLEKEAALFKAQNGDYTGIKELLRQYATDPEITGAHEVIGSHMDSIGKKFSRMGEVIPDHGKPYLPAPPATVKR